MTRGNSPIVRAAKWLAAITALAISIGPPLGYLYFGYRLEQAAIATRADLLAYQVSRLISGNPDYWQFETVRIGEMLRGSGDGSPADRHRLLGLDGSVIGESVAAGFTTGWPLLTARQDLFDYGETVGTIEITHPLKGLIERTAWVALASVIVGVLVFFGLRILPLRSLERAWNRIAFLASHDDLTRLPNRVLFLDRLQTALAVASRKGHALTVHSLDLDYFKAVNDTLGHAAGDALLRLAAKRMEGCLRQGDTLARLSGDEFAVIQDGTDRPETATRLAQRIIAEMEKPFDLAGQEALIGVSIGMVMVKPDSTETADDLLKHADLALYKSKTNGRGTYHFFEDTMDAELQERMSLEIDLRKAIREQQLTLYYQPQVDLASQHIIGLEALLRWHHPTRGDIPPPDFLRVAESTGLIFPLSEWVLKTACTEAAAWAPLRVAVNLSPTQFQQKGLIATVEGALRESGLPADRLELEITEEILLTDTERTLEVLNGLKRLGVHIVMDDFGIGYSSLGYLRRFPFDKIKIDRSFIADLNTSHDAQAIVRAIIGLSQALNIHINAEGVETPEQADRLRAEGCHEVQGFLYGAPMTKTVIDEIVRRTGSLKDAAPTLAAAKSA